MEVELVPNYPYKTLGTGTTRDFRNDLNENFSEISDDMQEHKDRADNIQAQVDNLVADGDSSPEAAQARVGADGTNYTTLKQRLDAENQSVTAQLADMETRKADQSFVDSQFAAIVSGAPKATYTNLAAIQNAYPNGTDGVVLALDNGHWYYWNSATLAWTDGGAYQATGVADGSITLPKLDDSALSPLVVNNILKKAIKSVNLTNTVTDENYYVKYIRRNYNKTWTVNIAKASDNNEVCQFNQTAYSEPAGLDVITLNEVNSSGITGTMIIDWDSLDLGGEWKAPPYSKSGFDYKTYGNLESSTLFKYSEYVNSSIKKAVKVVYLYNADFSNQYYIKYIKRNLNSGWTINIAKISDNTEVCQFNKTLYTEPTGLDIINLTSVNNSGITGVIVIDWTQITAGTAISISDYANALINNYFLNNVIDYGVSYPFARKSLISGDGIQKQQLLDAIKNISLYNAIPSERYFIKYIKRNKNGWAVNIAKASDGSEVCQFNQTAYSEPTGFDVIYLKKVNSSEITGKMVIDWSKLTSGRDYSLTIEKGELDPSTYTRLEIRNPYFSEGSIINADPTKKRQILNAILGVKLYNADPQQTYYIKYIRRNSNGAWTINIGKASDHNEVCQFSQSSYSEPDNKIDKLTLNAVNSSGVTGEILINWRALENGSEISGLTEVETAFSPLVHDVDDNNNIETSLAFDEAKDRLLLPPTMYFVDDLALPIYKSSIVSTADDLDTFDTFLVNVKSDGTPQYREFSHDIVLDGNELNDSFKIAIDQTTDDLYDYFQQINKSIVDKAAKQGKTFNYLTIADSLNHNSDVPSLIKNKLSNYGVTTNILGTFETSEARQGWSYRNFVGAGNLHADGTSIITPSSSGITTTLYQNPFLKLATDEDKANYPDWCFRNTGSLKELSYSEDTDKTGDFYIFDFAWYLSAHAISTPDVVMIALGTNDIINYPSSESVTGCKLALEIMIKQIKAANANIKIGIVPSTAWIDRGYYNSLWSNQVSAWIEQCMTDIKGYQNTYSDLYIVPAWCHMSKKFSWDYSSQSDLSITNQSQKAHIGDSLHYGAKGRAEYVNALGAFLMNVI